MTAKSAMMKSALKSARFAADADEHDEAASPQSMQHSDAHDEDEDADGVVRMPLQNEHTYYVLIRTPKGGINGLSALVNNSQQSAV